MVPTLPYEEEAVVLLLLTSAFGMTLAFGIWRQSLWPLFSPIHAGCGQCHASSGLPAEVSVAISTLLFGGFVAAVRAGAAGMAAVGSAGARGTGYDRAKQVLLTLPEEYPVFFTQQQVNELTSVIQAEMASMGQMLMTKGPYPACSRFLSIWC